MLFRRAALPSLTLAAFAALAACGGGGGEAAGGRRLAVIPKGTSHEFWKAVHAGSVRAGDDLGVAAADHRDVARLEKPVEVEVLFGAKRGHAPSGRRMDLVMMWR